MAEIISESDKKTLIAEATDVRRRGSVIVDVLRPYFSQTSLVLDRPTTEDDLERVKEAYVRIAPLVSNKVDAHFISHLLLASIYGQKLGSLKTGLLALVHDLGRFFIVNRYLVNDAVGIWAQKKLNMRPEFTADVAEAIQLIGLAKSHGKLITSIDDLTPAQRIIDVADNLGKRNPDGSLMNIEQMVAYSSAQPNRYRGGIWPLETTGRKALVFNQKQEFSDDLLLEEVRWLQSEHGVNFEELRESVSAEFEQPESQAFLLAFRDARETLDPKVDEKLKRPAARTVIFDVGGVLCHDDDPALIKILASLFESSEDEVLTIFQEINPLSMSGEISEEEYLVRFWQHFGKACPPNIEDARAPFIQPNTYKVVSGMPELVQRLSENTKLEIYILSNIISPLTPAAFEFIRNKYSWIRPENILYSCDIKASKQDPATPKSVLERLGNPNPESVLFIDDNTSYVDSFRRNDFRAFTFQDNPYTRITPAERLENELKLAGLI